MNLIDALQWPAMLITVAGAWLVGSELARRRELGFWTYLVSNALWIAWGIHSGAQALVALQLVLAAMNIRGERKSRRAEATARGAQ